ncbi:hypothetical protein FHU36_002707 [Nonomuraea muscovyensis]|uniref:Uncharacterized protein n=1 Tax=Nonomuraea muscovyensis TaxID=1124761 RepID=A0A7X0C0L7_9ACTN|nr:hypothetical protein [Nonomuraea muscovyensis]MBB6346198.1 hypothetical protein [Nonomuraea muscovyensis]
MAEVSLIIPPAIDPGQAEQTRATGTRSFVRGALHLAPVALARFPFGRVDGRRDDQDEGCARRAGATRWRA